jgi:hypothetical protein
MARLIGIGAAACRQRRQHSIERLNEADGIGFGLLRRQRRQSI